jgi:hypothetical protein
LSSSAITPPKTDYPGTGHAHFTTAENMQKQIQGNETQTGRITFPEAVLQ